jgi:hypothetical protein
VVAEIAATSTLTIVTVVVSMRGRLKNSREQPGQKQQGAEVRETTKAMKS